MEKKVIKPTEQKSSKGLVIVLGILVLALGGLSVLLYSKVVNYEEKFIDSQETVENQTDEINDLSSDLELKINEYQSLSDNYVALGLSNDSIQMIIIDLEAEVKKWKSRKWSSDAQRKKAKKQMEDKLAELQLDLSAKTSEIERLTLANDSLSSSVDSLIQANGYQVEDINDLSEKVAIASILKAEGIEVSTFNAKDKEAVKDAHKAKNIARVRVKFDLGENKVAKKDLKSIVLQIVEPKGSVLFDIDQGGGSFTKSDGHNDFYTKKQMVNFTNTGQEVNFFYEKGDKMEVGTYKIILYSEGYQIGNTSLVVK